MAEVEDGEILDTDEESQKPSDIGNAIDKDEPLEKKESSQQKLPFHHCSSKLEGRNVYRHKTDDSDDSSSATSDEDTDLWRCKKAKYFSKPREKSMELSYEICSPPRKKDTNSVAENSGLGRKRKVNNIWGTVLEEQTLTKCMTGVIVDKPDLSDEDDDREVEKYDYTKKYEDNRIFDDSVQETDIKPDIHNPFEDVLNSVGPEGLHRKDDSLKPDLRGRLQGRGWKRKKNAKDRLSEMTVDRSKDRGHIVATADDPKEVVLKAIVSFLDESNEDLFGRVVDVVGNKKALELTYLTDDVESAGGLLINNGSRRRTPGGVFLQLLKKDKNITAEQIKEIFAVENEKFKKKMKEQKKERRRRHRQAFKNLPQSKYINKPKSRDMETDSVDYRNSSHSDSDSNLQEDIFSGAIDQGLSTNNNIGNFETEQSDMLDLGVDEDCHFD